MTLHLPILNANGTRSPEGYIYLHYMLSWSPAKIPGPAREPSWIRALRIRELSDMVPLSAEQQTDLGGLLSNVLQQASETPDKKCDPKTGAARISQNVLQSLREYSRYLTRQCVPRTILDFLRQYAEKCRLLGEGLPPLLTIRTNLIPPIIWQWATLDRNAEDPLSDLWSKHLAIGVVNGTDPEPQTNEGTANSHGHPPCQLAVATRMVETYEKEQADFDKLTRDIHIILKAWDPWRLSKTTLDSFGRLFDPERTQRNSSGLWPTILSDTPAPVFVYHGHNMTKGTENKCMTLLNRLGPESDDFQKLPFAMQRLGAGQTLIMGACNTLEVGQVEDFPQGADIKANLFSRLPTSHSYAAGAAWVGTPTAIDNLAGLRFVRQFLVQACTMGAPVSELLRQTIVKLEEHFPDEYAWLTFMLHGDAQRVLPFVTRKRVVFHYSKEDELTLTPLISNLKNSPTTPIQPECDGSVPSLDDSFLQWLGLGEGPSTMSREPAIWHVSLAAIGRALTHPNYRRLRKRPLKILGCALETHGSTRLVKIGDAVTTTNAAYDHRPFFGFGRGKSFVCSLLKMYLVRQKQLPGHTISDLRINYGDLDTRLRCLEGLGADYARGCLFWGTDYSEDRLNSYLNGPDIHLVHYLQKCLGDENKNVDLDSEFCQMVPGANKNGTKKIPMLFFVTALADDGADEYFFAFRDFLRNYRENCRLDLVWQGIAGLRNSFSLCSPSYFRTVNDQQLEMMIHFIVEAVEQRLWGDIDEKLKKAGHARRLGPAIRKRVERSLYIDSETCQRGMKALKAEFGDEFDELYVENLMWEYETGMVIGVNTEQLRDKYAKAILDLTARSRNLAAHVSSTEINILSKAAENSEAFETEYDPTLLRNLNNFLDEAIGLGTIAPGEDRIERERSLVEKIVKGILSCRRNKKK